MSLRDHLQAILLHPGVATLVECARRLYCPQGRRIIATGCIATQHRVAQGQSSVRGSTRTARTAPQTWGEKVSC